MNEEKKTEYEIALDRLKNSPFHKFFSTSNELKNENIDCM